MNFIEDKEILKRITRMLSKLQMPYIDPKRLFCVRSSGSKARAYARIYSFPRVWQLALSVAPMYVIEVISEKFDKLSPTDRDRVLIHELMHIPRTFSGGLVPHKCFGRKRICAKTVEALYQKFLKD